jgi:hypothetical protein
MMLNEEQTTYLIDFVVSDMPFSQRLKMYKQVKKFQGFFDNGGKPKDPNFPGIGALRALSAQYSVEKELNYKARQLAGKCSNGAERDHGLVIHAVNDIGALCGAKPGRLSVGWVEPWDDTPVNCDKCLNRIEALRNL